MLINGQEVFGYNTILSAGFNLIGRRIFDSAYTTQAYWVRYDISEGNIVNEGTYTEKAATQHEVVGVYVLVLATSATITGAHLMKANSLLDADRVASFTITPALAVNNGDTIKMWWEFFVLNPNATWTSDGTRMIGHRCFDKTNTYNPVSHIAYWNSGVEQKIYAQTYSNISDTSHKITVTTDAAITSDSLRFYNAASGGTLYWNATGSRSYLNGFVHNLFMEISQT
jgi:hypothetical protein